MITVSANDGNQPSAISDHASVSSSGKDRYDLPCGDRVLHLSQRTHVMGILNVTPDSFFDGGRYEDTDHAVAKGVQMAEEGADIIDVGGESSRPGADSVDADKEIRRVIPVIQALRTQVSIPISIDTTKAVVAKAAIHAGAAMINDISALGFDPDMAHVAAETGVPVVLMHMLGTPKTMQKHPIYQDVVQEVIAFLRERITAVNSVGVSRKQIIVDPGIGFGKTALDNFVILKHLNAFRTLNQPLLLGVSRKSFIGWALDLPESERLMGTAAAVTASIMNGAHIIRVHDVCEMNQVCRVTDRIMHTGVRA